MKTLSYEEKETGVQFSQKDLDDLVHHIERTDFLIPYELIKFERPLNSDERKRVSKLIDAMYFLRSHAGIESMPFDLLESAKQFGVEYECAERDLDAGLKLALMPRFRVVELLPVSGVVPESFAKNVVAFQMLEYDSLAKELFGAERPRRSRLDEVNPLVQSDDDLFSKVLSPRVRVSYGGRYFSSKGASRPESHTEFERAVERYGVPKEKASGYVTKALEQITLMEENIAADSPIALAGSGKRVIIKGEHILSMISYAKKDLLEMQKKYS